MYNLVEISGVTKSYDGKKLAVDNVSLSLPKGRIIGLLGPNGSGKTTLIKMLNGLLKPTAGTILINGKKIGPATKARVAYLPDRTYLTGNKTVEEILDYFVDFYADFSRDKAMEMLGSLSIDPKSRMKNLSKGVKVSVTAGKVNVDLALNLSYGYSIPATSAKVQEKVKTAIENMTGLEVLEVNIRIAGVDMGSGK